MGIFILVIQSLLATLGFFVLFHLVMSIITNQLIKLNIVKRAINKLMVFSSKKENYVRYDKQGYIKYSDIVVIGLISVVYGFEDVIDSFSHFWGSVFNVRSKENPIQYTPTDTYSTSDQNTFNQTPDKITNIFVNLRSQRVNKVKKAIHIFRSIIRGRKNGNQPKASNTLDTLVHVC